MALAPGRKEINIGASPNDSNGDTIRDGGEKINHMFQEVYNAIGDGDDISFASSTTLAQIIAISSDLGSYVANTNTLMNKMDDVYTSKFELPHVDREARFSSPAMNRTQER